MSSQPNESSVSGAQPLVRGCSSEILAHRIIFGFVLAPLLGVWLPALLLSFSISVLLTIRGVDGDAVSDLITGLGILLSIIAGAWGGRRESQRLRLEHRQAIDGGMKLPEKARAVLAEQVDGIWRKLQGGKKAAPQLICTSHFRPLAHAYDDAMGRTIEVSAGLADRVARQDPLALSILHHEVAHLVHADIPVIRKQSVLASAVLFAMDLALAGCAAAAIGIAIVATAGGLHASSGPRLVNICLAICCAFVIVAGPLLLGKFAIRRYAGFIVALIEVRADVSAGLWGQGLAEFSRQLKQDPGIGGSTFRDYGLAYISPSLSHVPAQERAALLENPDRLATPKLRYFAVVLLTIWLFSFHQGSETWDFALLAGVVAMLQALAAYMVLSSRTQVGLKFRRAVLLAVGIVAAQALPLISIEGLAYLAEHLTAAIVQPGGFGTADQANYLQDTIETFQEFGRFIVAATGGAKVVMALVIAAGTFLLLSRFPKRHNSEFARLYVITTLITLVSVAVSGKFFQEELYWPVRFAAFRVGDTSGLSSGLWTHLPAAIRALVSRLLWQFSEFLHGPPILGEKPWLRLAIPNVATLLGALFLLIPRLSRSAMSNRRSPMWNILIHLALSIPLLKLLIGLNA